MINAKRNIVKLAELQVTFERVDWKNKNCFSNYAAVNKKYTLMPFKLTIFMTIVFYALVEMRI